MITPVVEQGTETPQPIIPPPNFERKNRTPMIIALIVAGVILLPLLLIGAGVFFLRAGSEEVVIGEITEAEQVDVVGEFDMEMGVQIVLEAGPGITLPEGLFPGEDRSAQEDSVQMVARVTSPAGVTDLYRYEAILLDSATQETLDCLGLSQGGNATVGCRDSNETVPLHFWSTDERSTGTWYSVAVAGLPMEATTLVTETVNGKSVGSAVVNGVAYQEWPASDGGQEFREAARTVALDAGGVVVWSADGNN